MAARVHAKKPTKVVDIAAESERYLAALARHSGLWATSAQLGFSSDERLTAILKRLRAEQRIVAVGKVRNSDAYALVGNGAPKESLALIAARVVRDQMRLDKLDLLPLSAGAKRYERIPKKVREYIVPALQQCVLRREAFPIKVGNSNFVALAANLKAVLGIDVAPEPQSAKPTLSSHGRSFDSGAVTRAYERLSAERRSPNVIVADLQQKSGTDLSALQAWLLAECRAHRAVPLLGEPAHATPEQLAAALQVEGRPHLYVRLVQEQS